MTRMQGGLRLYGAALALLATACGGGDDSTGSTGIVQLVAVTTNTLTISCGRLNHLSSPDSLYMHAHMVNTTASDVTVDSIGSTGTIIRASDEALVGQGALNFTSLPFNPQPTLLQARTGDVTMTVSVPTVSLCAASSALLDFKDISASIRVTTGVGQYVSVPVTIHVVYQ